MRKNILVVYGNGTQANKIRECVLEINDELEVYMAEGIGAAYRLLMETTMDVFIVDPVMDVYAASDASGIRFAQQIREMKQYVLTPLIFIAKERDPQMYAFRELNCLAYIVRPYQNEELRAAVEKALYYRTERNEEKSLFFRKKGIIYQIKVKDIVYIEKVARFMYVHMINGKIEEVEYKTYVSILREADSEYLFQCNRGIVVNKNYILGIDLPNSYIILKNGMGKVDIGVTYRKKILAEYEYEKTMLSLKL